MMAVRVALQVHRRRLERADRLVAQAAETQRRCEQEHLRCEAAVQQARRHAEQERERLWAGLMGKACDARSFDEVHAKLAYCKGQVAALEQQLLAACAALQQAREGLDQARKDRARQSIRTDKFDQWVVQEQAKLAQAELQRLEDEQSDVPRRAVHASGEVEATA